MDTIPLPVVMDGATGTELMARGMPQGVSTEQWVLDHPEVLLEVQRAYVRSGSQVLLAPTFGANRVGLSRCGAFHQVADYNRRLVELTQQAAEGKCLVAGDLAPMGLSLPPFGESGFEELVAVYTEQAAALAAAGVIGNIIKTNASISGAECGCQAEVGSACSMAAAGLAELYHMDLDQIEYAAEVAMEHHLGLTCDPIGGLVQIPCIERNAVAAMRAINALSLANFLTYTRKISFDMVVKTMYETGRDLFSKYRETSEGGLAKMYTE